LFGSPYDEERYRKVIHQCGLERDLELFEAGDQTEVGEKGLTLSGGQKARVTLARAIYSPAQTVLLDDILAALEYVFVAFQFSIGKYLPTFSVHTSKWIVDKCFAGDLVKGRTVLLVVCLCVFVHIRMSMRCSNIEQTHNIAMTRSLAEFAVSIGTDGTITAQGTILEVLGSDKTISEELKQDQKAIEKAEEEVDKPNAPSSDGKLIVAEEIEEGHISWQSCTLHRGQRS
jgi:hypothetical protein